MKRKQYEILRKLSWLLAGVVCLFSLAAMGEEQGTVAVDKLNVRSGPSTVEPIIGTLAKGDTIVIWERRGEWLRMIPSHGIIGWIESSALQGSKLWRSTSVHAGEGRGSLRLGYLLQGTQVRLLAKRGDWSQVIIQDGRNLNLFVHGSYVSRGVINTVPNARNLPASVPRPPVDGLKANYGVLVYDMTRRQEIWGQNQDKVMPIASLTKMMTLLMMFEEMERNASVTLNTMIPISVSAASAEPTKANLIAGQTARMEELLRVMILASCNDCAHVAGEFLGNGSMAQFAKKANARAKSLGMEKTVFFNASGLPNGGASSDNRGTPRDMLRLALAVWKYPQTREWTHRKEATMTTGVAKTSTFKGHTPLMDRYGVDGLKTGYTNRAGSCVVTHAKNASGEYMIVILGCERRVARDTLLENILKKLMQK